MASVFAIPTAATPVERILSRFDRKQIEDFIEVAISLLDAANDPDMEDSDPCCTHVDERGNSIIINGHDCQTEDDEDGDASEDDDPAGGSCDDEGEEINEAEPMAPLTLNPDRDSWLD